MRSWRPRYQTLKNNELYELYEPVKDRLILYPRYSHYFIVMFSYTTVFEPFAIYSLIPPPPLGVLVGQKQVSFCHAFRHWPLYTDVRIFPKKTAFIVRMIKVRYLVAEFRKVRQHKKAMCEALWDKELLFIFGGKNHTEPLAEGFGILT